MSDSKTLGIIALIIGIGSLGLGFYSTFILPNSIIDRASGDNEITQILSASLDDPFRIQ